MGKDILGGFHIPTHLLEKAKSFVAPKIPEAPVGSYTTVRMPFIVDGVKQTLVEYNASKGGAVHTVSVQSRTGTKVTDLNRVKEDVDFTCTCQGFKIQKKGYCKHTEQAAKDFFNL
jgi:hypothetical protein